MKIQTTKETLSRLLAIAGRAVSPRSTLPVLQCVLLDAVPDGLRVSATDLEIAITAFSEAVNVAEDGALAVPAKTFSDVVGALPDGADVTLSTTGKDGLTLAISAGRSASNVRCTNAAEYPAVPAWISGTDSPMRACVMPAALKRGIDQVAFAASDDESRPVLTGVNFVVADGALTLAAADGFRLSVKKIVLPIPLEVGVVRPEFSAIIPRRAAVELARAIGVGGPAFSPQVELVTLALNAAKTQVAFHLDNVDIVSQLVDGNFPDFDAIIPKSISIGVMAEVAEVAEAVRLARVFGRDADDITVLEVANRISENGAVTGYSMAVSASAAETGDGRGDVAVNVGNDNAAQFPFMVALRGAFLLDALGAIPDRVCIGLNAPTLPVRITSDGDESWTHVIMPMQLNR